MFTNNNSRFVIMDFEFGMLDRTNIVLISGAMSNNLDRYRTIQIEGRPLLLTKNRQVKTMGENEVLRAIKEICRIFKDKEELLFPVLRQMQDSINAKNGNLNIKCIKRYLEKNKSKPIVVFWNGNTDKEIMERLGLGNYPMLKISSYDVINNHSFYLQLKNIKTKEVIVSEEIGHFEKKGRITVVLLVACCSSYGIERYADEKIISHSGLFIENQGPIKIMKTKWNLVAFFDTSSFCERTKEINGFMESTNIYAADEKKRVIFESINHSRIAKRGIPYKTITKAAQILFELCDRFCIQRTNTVFNKLIDGKNTEVNFIEKQVKVIKLERDEGPDVLISINKDINELRNMTSEANMRSFLAYHFIQINLILELYIAETDILFDVIQAAKVGLIHPSLLTPKELLKQLLNIKIGLPSGTDLPIDLNESNIQEMIPLSDISIYYSNDKIVFILNIPLVYQYELPLFQLIPIPNSVSKSKEMYSVYDEIDQSLCKHADDFL
ncbi:Envelope fusion protein, partial [Aphis craccivora]